MLEQGKIDIFLGYKMVQGHPLPHCFTKDNLDELNELVTGNVRYSLEKFATQISQLRPGIKIGLLARDCNKRALNVLYTWNQLDKRNIKTIDLGCCPSRQKEHADCSYLQQQTIGSYKLEHGINNSVQPEEIENKPDRLTRWMYEFQKCIKCYGCRNICPVCFCEECSLEHKNLVHPGSLPPEIPIFHLIRAVHMAGRCIDCGLCEDACPMDIPLRLLYRQVNRSVQENFNYFTGSTPGQSPFNILEEKLDLEPRPLTNHPD